MILWRFHNTGSVVHGIVPVALLVGKGADSEGMVSVSASTLTEHRPAS